mmetsp:Transcript_51182/g.121654  ORF Transcript_51182/g.121654 Transcript_51182/m.121654 type:complete len:180 (-) Transcript_51182:79-618(-)
MATYSGVDVAEVQVPLPYALPHLEFGMDLLTKDAHPHSEGLDERIREAQERAAGKRGQEKGLKQDVRPLSPVSWIDPASSISPEQLLGGWVDSLGNAVLVSSVDAFSLRLVATLSQPPRKDIHLALKPMPGGGWQCGNACLDPVWTSATQLHWLTGDGRISVWVRLQEEMLEADAAAGM